MKSHKILLINLIAFCNLFIGNSLSAQLPNIHYDRNHTLYSGVQISKIIPVNSGGEIPPLVYGETTTYAGSVSGFVNGNGDVAKFKYPQGIAVNATGEVFVADRSNHAIRKISTTGVVSTVAGTGNAGFVNGNSSIALFAQPADVAFDSKGNIYVSELTNHTIRKITPDGIVSTVAGTGSAGYVNGSGNVAKLNTPMGLAIDKVDNIYVGDRYNHRVRLITTTGDVSTYAGNGAVTGINAQGESASFNNAAGVAVNTSGILYVSDYGNNLIRRISTQRYVSSLAGCFCGGLSDGVGDEVGFKNPYGMSVGPTGDIFVTEFGSHRIRRASPDGEVTTLAGTGNPGKNNGIGIDASFNMPSDVAVDSEGNVFVADYGNHQIRKIVSTGYTITPSLPEGLIFNSATGEISGTPLQVIPPTEFQITGYNKSGKSTSNIVIQVLSLTVLDKQEYANDFVLYPNPLSAGDKLIAILPTVDNEYKEVILRDESGRILFSKEFYVINNRMEIEINVSIGGFVFVEIAGVGTKAILIANKK